MSLHFKQLTEFSRDMVQDLVLKYPHDGKSDTIVWYAIPSVFHAKYINPKDVRWSKGNIGIRSQKSGGSIKKTNPWGASAYSLLW